MCGGGGLRSILKILEGSALMKRLGITAVDLYACTAMLYTFLTVIFSFYVSFGNLLKVLLFLLSCKQIVFIQQWCLLLMYSGTQVTLIW